MQDESDFESEVNSAYQAFSAAMASGGALSKGRTATGHNFWDVVMRFSHSELEDMIAHLERNSRNMTPQELVRRHLEIVSYFDRIGHLRAPGTKGFNSGELEDLAALYHREEKQGQVERQLAPERMQLQQLNSAQRKLAEYFRIMDNHLYRDPRSLINPKERDDLMNDTDIRMRAYRFFLKETKGEPILDENDASSVTQLVALNPAHGLSQEALVSARLRDKVTAYMLCSYFRKYVDGQIESVNMNIGRLESQLREVKLRSGESAQLRTFEKGGDRVYSPSNYYAAYTNAVWTQVVHVLRQLHQAGVKIVMNI